MRFLRGRRANPNYLFIGVFAASACSGGAAEVSTTQRALTYSEKSEDSVIYAKHSAYIEDGAIITGHVGVATLSAGTPSDTIADGVRLSVGPWANVGWTNDDSTFAYQGLFRYGSNTGHAYTNQVVFDHHYLGYVYTGHSLSMEPFPRARPVYPDEGVLTVTAGSTVTVTSTDTFAHIDVGYGGVLQLEGGEYQVHCVTLADAASIIALDNVELRVSGRFQGGNRVELSASSNNAGALRIEALSANGGLGGPIDTPRAFDLGERSRVRALLFAPLGTIKLGYASTATGAVVADHVWIDIAARVAYEDGLQPLSGVVPLAYPDSYSGTEDEVLTVAAEGVLGNDLDPKYQAITATLLRHAKNGTVALSSNGSFTFTPATAFEGQTTFTYRASDGTYNSSTATVTLTIDGVNDAPVITSFPPQSAFVGQLWRYSVVATDIDAGDDVDFSLSGAPSGVSIDADTGLGHRLPGHAHRLGFCASDRGIRHLRGQLTLLSRRRIRRKRRCSRYGKWDLPRIRRPREHQPFAHRQGAGCLLVRGQGRSRLQLLRQRRLHQPSGLRRRGRARRPGCAPVNASLSFGRIGDGGLDPGVRRGLYAGHAFERVQRQLDHGRQLWLPLPAAWHLPDQQRHPWHGLLHLGARAGGAPDHRPFEHGRLFVSRAGGRREHHHAAVPRRGERDERLAGRHLVDAVRRRDGLSQQRDGPAHRAQRYVVHG